MLAASTAAWSQTGLRFEAMQAALSGNAQSTASAQRDPVSALADYMKASSGARSPHGSDAQDDNHALLDYTQQLDAERPQLISADQPAHALGGNGPNAVSQVDFRPACAAYLAGARRGEDGKFECARADAVHAAQPQPILF